MSGGSAVERRRLPGRTLPRHHEVHLQDRSTIVTLVVVPPPVAVSGTPGTTVGGESGAMVVDHSLPRKDDADLSLGSMGRVLRPTALPSLVAQQAQRTRRSLHLPPLVRRRARPAPTTPPNLPRHNVAAPPTPSLPGPLPPLGRPEYLCPFRIPQHTPTPLRRILSLVPHAGSLHTAAERTGYAAGPGGCGGGHARGHGTISPPPLPMPRWLRHAGRTHHHILCRHTLSAPQ